MARSRRRYKKHQPKVRVGVVKTKKNQKAMLPAEITEQRSDVEKRLNQGLEWEEERTLTRNYKANKFVLDANAGVGSKAARTPLVPKEERAEAGEETYSDDDELRAACNRERKTGKAPPPRLTATQTRVVEALVARHGDDVEAMFRDTKLNRMQHSVGRLRELIEAHRHWGADGAARRHDFRGPNKPYKRL